jgi:hypothetical protein
MGLKICKKCHKTYTNKEYDSEEHIDQHTPYFLRNGKIMLSGADQVRLMLKCWHGSWEKLLSNEQKRIQQKGDYDYKKALKLQKFEERHGIEFVVLCNNEIIYRGSDQK